MNINKDFKCEISNDKFHIVDIEGTSPIKENSKTLKKIEYILQNELQYQSTTDTDRYSNYSKYDLYEKLKNKAIDICNKSIGTETETYCKTIVERIIKYTDFTTMFPSLPHEVTKQIVKDFSISDLGNLTRVNRSSKIHTSDLIIQHAKEFGFKGNNYRQATKYLNSLYLSLKQIYKEKKFNVETTLRSLPKFPTDALINIITKNFSEENKPLFDYLINFCLSNKTHTDKAYFRHHSRMKQADSALIAACTNNKSDFVKILLELNANPDAENDSGQNALQIAISKNNEQMVRHLVDHDVYLENCNSKTHFYTPLCIAANIGYVNIAKILLDKGAKVEGNDLELTPLSIAIFNNDVKMVKLLLEYGAEKNLILQPILFDISCDADFQWWGTSLLYLAFFKGQIEIVDELLKAGANINILDSKHYTPLMRTCLITDKNFLQIASQILDRGADINIQHAVSGDTALMMATTCKNTEMVKLLLEHGADPNIMNNTEKNTPLHTACLNGDSSIVTKLVEHAKTNVNLRNAKGETPLAIAIKNVRPKLAVILKKHGGGL